MDMTTARLALPLIAPGQAQKELTHNEALTLIDAVVQATVQAVGVDTPPAAPGEGAAWIVGAAPTGTWATHADALAAWTAGGWRFVAAREGLAVWDAGGATVARYRGGAWRQATAVAAPAGGNVIDTEARAALVALLSVLRGQGILGA